MPWSSIDEVPARVRTHKNAKLTLAQANKWAEIYDAIKNDPKIDNPAAVAWSSWENLYKMEDGKWVSKSEGSKTESEKKSRKDYMESVVFMSDSFKVQSDDSTGNKIVHGVAVTTNVSNNHRFPEDILERDIGTLIGQPLVEGHSIFPDDVEVKDMYGMVVDAWYDRENKRAEFLAEVWDENYKIVLDKMPHRVKFSVGFCHDYDVEEDTNIHISKSVFFDHIGTTNRPADTDSVLLGIKKDAEALGQKIVVLDERTIVVEPNAKIDSKGGNAMSDEEKQKKKDETKSEDDKKSEEEVQDEATGEQASGQEQGTPPAEPPAQDDESDEAGEKKTAEVVKRLEATERALKEEQSKRKELEKKVLNFEASEKRRKVMAYVEELIAKKVKLPSQKEALIGQYLSYNEEQMKREMELNEVAGDLSEVFGEKAMVAEKKEDDQEFKEPDRKTIV